MRSSDEPIDTFGQLPAKKHEPAPAPAPQVRQISEHVFEVDGRFETRNYPTESPKPKQAGWQCRLSEEQLAFLDALEC